MSQYFRGWEGLLLHTAAGRYNSGSSRWTPERTQSSCAETAGRITLQAATVSMCRVARGPATRAPSAAWLRQGQGLGSTHTVGARADITAHYQHSHSRCRPEGSSSSCRLCWHAHGPGQAAPGEAGSPWGSHGLGRQPLGRSTQWFLSWQECSIPPTSHRSLEPDLGQTGPGSALPCRQPRSQVAAQPLRSSKPQHPGPQCHPSTRSGTNTTEKGSQPWAASRQNLRRLHRWRIGLL